MSQIPRYFLKSMIEELNRSVREDIPMQEVLCGWPDTYSKPPSPT